MRLVKLPIQVAAHVELERFGAEVFRILDAALLHEHLPDHLLGIEHVDWDLDEHRPRDPVLGEIQRLLEGRLDAVDLLDRDGPFGDRLHHRDLIDVLQRTAAFEGREVVEVKDLEFAVSDYIAPTAARREEIEYMQLLAVAACTSRSLLPEEYIGQIESGALYRRLRELELELS